MNLARKNQFLPMTNPITSEAQIQARIRRRVLSLFKSRGVLPPEETEDMLLMFLAHLPPTSNDYLWQPYCYRLCNTPITVTPAIRHAHPGGNKADFDAARQGSNAELITSLSYLGGKEEYRWTYAVQIFSTNDSKGFPVV